jgi:hypothetical protein
MAVKAAEIRMWPRGCNHPVMLPEEDDLISIPKISFIHNIDKKSKQHAEVFDAGGIALCLVICVM